MTPRTTKVYKAVLQATKKFYGKPKESADAERGASAEPREKLTTPVESKVCNIKSGFKLFFKYQQYFSWMKKKECRRWLKLCRALKNAAPMGNLLLSTNPDFYLAKSRKKRWHPKKIPISQTRCLLPNGQRMTALRSPTNITDRIHADLDDLEKRLTIFDCKIQRLENVLWVSFVFAN